MACKSLILRSAKSISDRLLVCTRVLSGSRGCYPGRPKALPELEAFLVQLRIEIFKTVNNVNFGPPGQVFGLKWYS